MLVGPLFGRPDEALVCSIQSPAGSCSPQPPTPKCSVAAKQTQDGRHGQQPTCSPPCSHLLCGLCCWFLGRNICFPILHDPTLTAKPCNVFCLFLQGLWGGQTRGDAPVTPWPLLLLGERVFEKRMRRRLGCGPLTQAQAVMNKGMVG